MIKFTIDENERFNNDVRRRVLHLCRKRGVTMRELRVKCRLSKDLMMCDFTHDEICRMARFFGTTTYALTSGGLPRA